MMQPSHDTPTSGALEQILRRLVSIHLGLAEEPGDLETSRRTLRRLKTLMQDVQGMIEAQQRTYR